jgi:hypothetical protein
MTDVPVSGRTGAPWHFWVVAVVGLLWNSFGGYDYTMSHISGEAYYRQMGMTDAQITYMAAYPSWMHAVWAIGVWGSVAGAVLLLLRMRWAFQAFCLSTLGALGALIFTATVGEGARIMGLIMPAVIVVVCLVFVWYAQRMVKAGVLR